MDPVRRFNRPNLRSPQALVAWKGWNDASDAASGAAAFMLGQYDLEPFAIIEPEDFYDFQSTRPTIEIDEGGTRRLTWPTTRFYAVELPDQPHDLVVVLGDEPNLQWKTYTRHVTRTLAETDVEMVVTLGAFIGEVAHSVPVPLLGVATEPSVVARYGLATSDYEGPTGIVGVALEACREIGIPALSLWAAAPHYLAANPNPAVMLALLQKASEVLRIEMDSSELAEVATEFIGRVDEAMAQNEDFIAYVQRLESEAGTSVGGPIDPRASDRLITEIEHFLRNHDA
jgi:proteasome assembly chaperone (PAC2) family protein